MSKDRSASCLACFVRATTGGNAPSLKSVEEATSSRHKILYAFEVAERLSDPLQRRAWLTFVIVGAGATGVELAGAIGEIVPRALALRRSFRVSRLLRPRRLSVASFRERALRPLAAPGPGVRGRSHVVLGDDRVSAPGDRHHGTDAVTFERYRADRVRPGFGGTGIVRAEAGARGRCWPERSGGGVAIVSICMTVGQPTRLPRMGEVEAGRLRQRLIRYRPA